jgi:hypothetical protein
VLWIDGHEAGDGETKTIALGRKVPVEALWVVPGTLPEPVGARWALGEAHPDWEREHASVVAEELEESPTASQRGVFFGDKVVLLFDNGNPDEETPSRVVWPIHCGDIVLRAATETSPTGDPASVEVRLEVTYDHVDLGQTWNGFDGLILRWANAFGYPPQYIKSLILQETGNFDPRQYRYEPLQWDWGRGLRDGGVKDRLRDPYFAPFRYPEPSTSGVGAWPHGIALSQTDKDGRSFSTFGQQLFSYDTVTRQCTGMTAGLGDLTVWSLFLGSNGLEPQRGPRNPCGQRVHWDDGADIYAWDSLLPRQWPSGHYPTWWFAAHKDYVAQMFVSASYGLMQVGYPTDLFDMDWFLWDRDRRHWADITHPNKNIYLGTRWLAWPAATSRGFEQRAGSEAHSLGTFESLLMELACRHNVGHLGAQTCGDYSTGIVSFLPLFTPELQEGGH